MLQTKAYEEIIYFIAAGSSPEKVIAFRPSREVQERVSELVDREKHSTLSEEETAELNQYLLLEHLMRMAKAKARQILAE